MLNVRFDFGLIGRLFGVPRKFLSQVGAFCASFSSGHQIIDVQTPAFPDPDKAPVTVGINEEHLRAFIAAAVDISSCLTDSDVGVPGGVAAYSHGHQLSEISDFPSSSASSITVVTDVDWDGTQLVVSKATISLSNGIVTGCTATTGRNIGTVTYNP